MIPLLLIVGFLADAVVLSLAVEALRPRPDAPQTLYWDPAITIRYAVIDGLRIRHIKTGSGPNLVLLHTLRTQLDVFEKLIPRLAEDFTVHATAWGSGAATSSPGWCSPSRKCRSWVRP